MAYIKMTDEELKALGINGQNSGYLNKSTGYFTQSGWEFISKSINNLTNQVIYLYSNNSDNVFLIRNATNINDTITHNLFEFYKEV